MRFARELVDGIEELPPHDPSVTLDAIRERMAGLVKTRMPPADPSVITTDETIAVDGRDVPVRFYRRAPVPSTPVPAVVYIHGGAFAIGDLETGHAHSQAICARMGAVVVSVDYRLAPEHPFPAGFEDCYGVLRHLAAEAATLGIDETKIAVCGASAGGCLAAAAALRARDEDGPPVAFQCLLYPALDDTTATASVEEVDDPRFFNGDDDRAMWPRYLGGAEPTAYAAPARADDLHGLPPSYVLAMQVDPLRDEALDYARRLIAAGVPTTIHHVAGAIHSFPLFVGPVPQAAETDGLWLGALERGLTTGFTD